MLDITADRGLSEEQRLMRQSCRAFVDDVVIPFIRQNWQRAVAHPTRCCCLMVRSVAQRRVSNQGPRIQGGRCYAALRLVRNSPMRSSALRMFSVELA